MQAPILVNPGQPYGIPVNFSEDNTSTQNHDTFMDAAARAKTQQRGLILPGGTFNVDPVTIAPWHGLLIEGSGPKSCTWTNPDTAGGVALTLDIDSADDNAEWIALRGFSLLGNASSGAGLAVGDGQVSSRIMPYFRLDRLSIRDHGGDGVRFGGRMDFAQCQTCEFNANGGHGFNLTNAGTNFISVLSFDACAATRNETTGKAGLRIAGSTNIVSWRNGEFGNEPYGVLIESDGAIPGQVTIAQTRFEGCTTNQLRATTGVRLTLEDVAISDMTADLTQQIYLNGLSRLFAYRITSGSIPAGGVLFKEASAFPAEYVDVVAGVGYAREDSTGAQFAVASQRIMQSPDGTNFHVSVADNGTISASEA